MSGQLRRGGHPGVHANMQMVKLFHPSRHFPHSVVLKMPKPRRPGGAFIVSEETAAPTKAGARYFVGN